LGEGRIIIIMKLEYPIANRSFFTAVAVSAMAIASSAAAIGQDALKEGE
jgi:hypothetical protein